MSMDAEARRRAEVIAVILRGLKAYAPDEVETYGHDEAEMIADYVVPYVADAVAQAVREKDEEIARLRDGLILLEKPHIHQFLADQFIDETLRHEENTDGR